MSHVVKEKMVIKDLDTAEKVAQTIGMELVRNVKNYKWFGRWVGDYPLPEGFKKEDLGKCEHVLRVKNASNYTYEIGLCKNPDGEGFVMMYDFWAGGHGLEAVAGPGCRNFKSAYSEAITSKFLRKKGYAVSVTMKDGRKLVKGVKL